MLLLGVVVVPLVVEVEEGAAAPLVWESLIAIVGWDWWGCLGEIWWSLGGWFAGSFAGVETEEPMRRIL